jgi:hypothetical protein
MAILTQATSATRAVSVTALDGRIRLGCSEARALDN